MLKLPDALRLARTKFRTKRSLLFTSIAMTSLLCGSLVAGVTAYDSLTQSLRSIVSSANNGAYRVSVSMNIPEYAVTLPTSLSEQQVQDILAFQSAFYKKIRSEHEAKGIAYNPNSEIPALTPAAWLPENLPESQRVALNRQSPVTAVYLQQRLETYLTSAVNTGDDLTAKLQSYNTQGTYEIRPSGLRPIPSTRLIVNGDEDFGDSELQSEGSTNYGYLVNAMHNSTYDFEDDELLAGYTSKISKDKLKNLSGIPVVVTVQEAVKLFAPDLGDQPKDESKKAAWIKAAEQALLGYTYNACYRNATEQALINQIQQASVMTEAAELEYGYPDAPCGDIRVVSDKRSPDAIAADETSVNEQRLLGTYIAPEHKLLTFQIIGLMTAEAPSDASRDISSYLKSLFTYDSVSSTAKIASGLYETLPSQLKLPSSSATTYSQRDEFSTKVISFSNIDEANDFIKTETCPIINTDCDKPYKSEIYGPNFPVLNELETFSAQIMAYALPIGLILVGCVIWFTFSRTIIESRRETAVFRAMGARRHHIVAIYLTYVLIVVLIISTLSIIVGVGGAYILDILYGQHLTEIVSNALGSIAYASKINLASINPCIVISVVLILPILAACASVIPLTRNVLRQPVQDMREG